MCGGHIKRGGQFHKKNSKKTVLFSETYFSLSYFCPDTFMLLKREIKDQQLKLVTYFEVDGPKSLDHRIKKVVLFLFGVQVNW